MNSACAVVGCVAVVLASRVVTERPNDPAAELTSAPALAKNATGRIDGKAAHPDVAAFIAARAAAMATPERPDDKGSGDHADRSPLLDPAPHPEPARPRTPAPARGAPPHRRGSGDPRADPGFPQQAGLPTLRVVLRVRLRGDPRAARRVASPDLSAGFVGGYAYPGQQAPREVTAISTPVPPPSAPTAHRVRACWPSRRSGGCGWSRRSRACATG